MADREDTWGEALRKALHTVPESAVNAAKSVGHAVAHPLETIGGLGSAQMGLYGLAGLPGVDTRSKDAANAAMKHYGQYMSSSGLKHAVATDPVGTVMDIAPVLPSPIKAARAAGIGRYAGILSKTGEFTPKAMEALSKASSGRITAADLQANPEFRAKLVKTMQNKGVSPAAAREAILAHHDAPVSRSRVTNTPAPLLARDVAHASTQEGKAAVSRAVGTGPVNTTAAGEALADAYKDSYNGYTSKYNAVMNGPEHFKPQAGQVVKQGIEQALKDQSLDDFLAYPTRKNSQVAHRFIQTQLPALMDSDTMTVQRLETMRKELNNLQQAAERTGSVDDVNTIGAMRSGFDEGLMNAAKNGFLKTGDPQTFVSGLQDARDAFREHQERFRSQPGVRAAVDKLDLKPDPNGLISMDPSPANAENASHTIVNSILDTKRGTPKPSGSAAYDRWNGVLGTGGAQALDETLRNHITQIPHGESEMAIKGRNLQNFLQTPVGQQLYPSSAEATKLNLAGEAQNILGEMPRRADEYGSMMSDVAQSLKDRAARSAKGALIGAVGGNPIVGAAAGALSSGLEDQFAIRRAARKEMAGAPDERAFLNKAADVADTADNTVRPVQAAGAATHLGNVPSEPKSEQKAEAPDPWAQYAEAPSEEQPVEEPRAEEPEKKPETDDPWAKYAEAPMRQARASGGSVKVKDIEHLVVALLSKAKKAKKQGTLNTEGLLNHEDSAIVAALDAAKRAI